MDKDEARLLAENGSTTYQYDSKNTFRPATLEGTPDVVFEIEAEDQKALHDFISLKCDGAYTIEINSQSGLYHSLGVGEIRILELFAGDRDERFKGALHVVSIDFEYPERVDGWRRYTNHAVSLERAASVYYTALSYAWGPPLFEARIYIKGNHELRITRSLTDALRQLRLENESTYLWIDQICIDQSNVKEKEQQIPLMNSIYRHATNTVIWLGSDENGSAQSAFNTMETVHSRLDLCEKQISPAEFKDLHLPAHTSIEWYRIKCLFRQPWFYRLWTIQELMLSLKAYVKYGSAVAAWPDFAAWCSVLEYTGILRWLETDDADSSHIGPDLSSSAIQGCSIVNELEKERYYLASMVHNSSILSVLVATRHAKASEPKDKVYGILGISSHHIAPSYTPDVPVRQVYTEACIEALPNDVFFLLSCVDHEPVLRPSWVPDWSVPRITESLGYSTKSRSLYSAGTHKKKQNSEMTLARYPILGDNNSTLTLRGKIFGTVASLGPVAAAPSLSIDNPAERNTTLTAYGNMASRYKIYPTGETIYDAFWKTLVANKVASGNSNAPQEFSEVFSLILDSSTGNMPSLSGQAYSNRRVKGYLNLTSLRSRRPAQVLEELRKAFHTAARNRCFAILEMGYFGLLPRGANSGDMICVFDGGHVPFVVREASGGYELVGECYIHGIMHGEVMELKDVKFQEIALV